MKRRKVPAPGAAGQEKTRTPPVRLRPRTPKHCPIAQNLVPVGTEFCALALRCALGRHHLTPAAWPAPIAADTPAPGRGSRRTSPRTARASRTPPAAAGPRRARTAARHRGAGTGHPPVCPPAGRATATRSRGRCSTPRSRHDTPCAHRRAAPAGGKQALRPCKAKRPPARMPAASGSESVRARSRLSRESPPVGRSGQSPPGRSPHCRRHARY